MNIEYRPVEGSNWVGGSLSQLFIRPNKNWMQQFPRTSLNVVPASHLHQSLGDKYRRQPCYKLFHLYMGVCWASMILVSDVMNTPFLGIRPLIRGPVHGHPQSNGVTAIGKKWGHFVPKPVVWVPWALYLRPKRPATESLEREGKVSNHPTSQYCRVDCN